MYLETTVAWVNSEKEKMVFLFPCDEFGKPNRMMIDEGSYIVEDLGGFPHTFKVVNESKFSSLYKEIENE